MCHCIAKSKGDTIKFLADNKKDSGIVGDGDFKNQAFSFSKGGEVYLYHEFEYDFTPIKKNGEQGKTMKKRISIYPTYCPFCGKKTNIE